MAIFRAFPAKAWQVFLRFPPFGFVLLLAADLLWHMLKLDRRHTLTCGMVPYLLCALILTVACIRHAGPGYGIVVDLFCLVTFCFTSMLAIVGSQLVQGLAHRMFGYQRIVTDPIWRFY